MAKFKRFAGALALCLCAQCLAIPADARVYEGLDVSVWQGAINFEEVKADGRELVYIRAGYGETEDSRFRTNAYSANAAGLEVGYYFFVTAQTAQEAQTQAEFFARLISDETYSCRPAVDFETFEGLSDGEINAVGLAFAQALQNETGHTPLFYTDVSAAESIWEESLTAYPLWIADYGVSAPESTGRWSAWAGFQYSDAGRVDGITGDVDLDRFTEAVFLEESGAALPFADVTEADWFYGAVETLYRDGLINGTGDTAFSPYESAARAAVVTVLYRLDGSPVLSGGSGFSDVPSGLWYSGGAAWAGQNGIAEGYGNGIFSPLSGASRQELALFLYRYAVFKGYDTGARGSLSAFTDGGTVADWAETAVRWAVGTKILRGVSAEKLSPESTASRAQLAVMISRFIALYGT